MGDMEITDELSAADERFVQHMRDLLYVRRDWSFDRRASVEPHEILASVKSLGWSPSVTDENDFPIVELPGSLGWRNAYEFGQTLEGRFPGQCGYDLSTAMEYNGQGPLSETNGIANLVMTKEGERDESSWVWQVTCQDGSVWFAEGWCDYTGWDCQSGLDWNKA